MTIKSRRFSGGIFFYLSASTASRSSASDSCSCAASPSRAAACERAKPARTVSSRCRFHDGAQIPLLPVVLRLGSREMCLRPHGAGAAHRLCQRRRNARRRAGNGAAVVQTAGYHERKQHGCPVQTRFIGVPPASARTDCRSRPASAGIHPPVHGYRGRGMCAAATPHPCRAGAKRRGGFCPRR